MNDPAALKAIFELIESTVIATGHQKDRTRPMSGALRDVAARAAAKHTDADYFRILVRVIFYSGMKAAVVNKKVSTIDKHFPSYSEVAGYKEREVSKMLGDPDMLRNEKKIRTCIAKAKIFKHEVETHGSFAAYLRGFASVEENSVEALRPLWAELHNKFLGKIISFHYLMETGYTFVKPDRVIARIFSRLRLVKGLPNPDHPDPQRLTDEQLWQIVQVGQQMAAATQLPIRYVDVVLVVFGQTEATDAEDLPQGVCLDKKPRCSLCEVRDFCHYEPKPL